MSWVCHPLQGTTEHLPGNPGARLGVSKPRSQTGGGGSSCGLNYPEVLRPDGSSSFREKVLPLPGITESVLFHEVLDQTAPR